jgi:hypothetical protein
MPAPNASQPARFVAHHLQHDDAMMAVRRAVQAIDRFGGNAECRIEAKGRIGQRHIVVDGLGQRDYIQALLHQVISILMDFDKQNR